jgi:leucyl/phenylalanyl-tRNA--protein transferase
VVFLTRKLSPFPSPESSTPEGLLAVGGDLSLDRLLLAYRSGIFPWQDRPLTWWSPDPRAIFELSTVAPPSRLVSRIKQNPFHITFDTAFESVIRNCAKKTPDREETWISPTFVRGYTALHRAGYAHSVEVWRDQRLVGGIYGVAIGGFFAGESMFHRENDASKIALFHLFSYLKERGYLLFDTQVLNPFTAQLGATEISRQDYLRRLATALAVQVSFR